MQIDLGNPQVRSNFLKSQIEEGNGEFFEKEKVLIFRDAAGGEHVVPDELIEKFKAEKEAEVVEEEPEKKKAGRPKKAK